MKVRATVLIGCLAVASGGCDRGLYLRIELHDGGSRISAAAFRKGLLFGESRTSFCPHKIVVEEQLEGGSKRLLTITRREQECERHHQWSIPLVGADGAPLFSSYEPRRRIAISIVTERGEVGGSGWIALRN